MLKNATLSPNERATFFLVKDDSSQMEPVCVSYREFRSSSAFIKTMEDKSGIFDSEDASSQFFDDMPCLRGRYAVVRLKWSGATFVIRRNSDDLQALENRVICAWMAKEKGELDSFEFEIQVTIKMEL